MGNEVVYGMLMRKNKINEEFYIFSPIHLIKGVLMSENVFVDELSNYYSIICTNNDYNQSIIYDSEEYCVGYYIEEEKLINIYPDDIIENAKMNFFEQLKSSFALAYYHTNNEQFHFMELDVDLLLNNLSRINSDEIEEPINNKAIDEFEQSEIVVDDEIAKKSQNFIMVDKEGINYIVKLLNDKKYNDVISILSEMKNSFKTLEEPNENITIDENKESKEKEEKLQSEIHFNNLYSNIRKKVIDQDDAILDIITAVKMDQYAESPSERSRCFIIGPTGSGKTEILKTLGEYLDKPFIKIDTTQLTTPGYVGGTIEQQLSRLINLSKGDIKKAEHGIVVFDEIDKKCNSRDELFGKGFLDTLLPFLDGTDYIIPISQKENKIFNTSNLTVFASGSFLEIIKKHALDKKPIGFNAEIKNESITKPKVDAEEIFKMSGMPDEFIGRFPVVVQLDELSKESLMKILEQSEISQLQAEKRKFKHLGVDLSWEEKYVEAVAIEAKKLNRGARSLKKIVERTIKYMRREILMNDNKYSNAILLEETVQNPKIYKLK